MVNEKQKQVIEEFIFDICDRFSPEKESEIRSYLDSNLDNLISDLSKLSYRGESQLNGMIAKAQVGEPMSRPPFGYIYNDKKLIPAQNSKEVEEIFEEFLNSEISLTQLAKKHQLSVNGLKKILTNFTYLGKVRFNNQIHEGNHQPILSSTLFNHVQNKIDRLGIKRI